MRNLQARPSPGRDHGIETLGFRAEVHCSRVMTIHAKDTCSPGGSTTGVAVHGAVFMGVSAGQKSHERRLTYWIGTLLSLMLISEE